MSHEHDGYDDGFDLPRYAVPRNPPHPQMDYYDDRRPASLSRSQSQTQSMQHPPSMQPAAPMQQSQSMPQDVERADSRYYYDPYAQAQEHIRRPSYAEYSEPKPPPSPSYSQQSQQYYRDAPMDQRFGTPRAPTSSTPGTPMTGQYPRQFYPPKPRQGFRQVHDPKDLQPRVNPAPPGRRFADGTYLSPLRALTTHITQTYHICNPEFRYESAHNPRRVLTKPSKPAHNDGYDNEDYDYILYVNDWLGPDDGRK